MLIYQKHLKSIKRREQREKREKSEKRVKNTYYEDNFNDNLYVKEINYEDIFDSSNNRETIGSNLSFASCLSDATTVIIHNYD